MAIKGLSKLDATEEKLPRAGIIRLGYKTRYCQNKQCRYKLAYEEADTPKCPKCGGAMSEPSPTESPFFVLKDAPGVAEAIGDPYPTELKIFFPFDDIDRNFVSFRTLYQGGVVSCQGDGEKIVQAVNMQTGQNSVKDGLCLLPFSEKDPTGKTINHQPGDFMPCPAFRQPNLYAKCAACGDKGILLVQLVDVPRMAYFQISTGSFHNLEDLPRQMQKIKNVVRQLTGFDKLSGVPFILRRALTSMVTITKDKTTKQSNGRIRVQKYTLQLEVQPEFMMALFRAQQRLLLSAMSGITEPASALTLPPGGPVSILAEPVEWEDAAGDEIYETDFQETPEETSQEEAPQSYASPDDLLFAISQKLSLSETEARALLKRGWHNGFSEAKSQQMYDTALKQFALEQ